MDIETSNAIKLFFPNPSLVQVLFEAVANALDADATEISIKIEIQAFPASETLQISITDNGSGFTDESFDRFKQLLKTQDSFHKGLGRLVFLNYFGRIFVESVWGANRRTFVFSESFQGENQLESLASAHPSKTMLVFTNFTRERIKSYDDLKPAALKERIIEQFLPILHEYRRSKRDFTIKLELHTRETHAQKEFLSGEEVITAADLPDLTSVIIEDPFLDAFDGVEMFYRVKSGMGERNLLTAAIIDRRTIPIKLLQPGSVPPDNSAIFLFSSKLFEGKADTSRQKLNLPDNIPEAELLQVLRREVGKVLSEKIPQIHEKNARTEVQLEEQFPHLLGLFEETTVGLIDKDEALDIAQRKFFKAQKEVLQCAMLDDSTFEKSLELSSRTLTEYVLYRDKIIGKMREMTMANSEADMHNLIVPRWKQFQKGDFMGGLYRNNAWLLDDKFMTFQTILSEQRMDTIIDAITLQDEVTVEDGRPDIAMIFSADPAEATAVDVVVVEIKKKTDDEKENQYVINQLLDRAVKLAVHCPNIQRIWYYAVIQIGDNMVTRLRQQKWAPLFSKGKVFYQEFPTERPNGTVVPTPTFVISFDAIVADAECRNHTFLQILRHGMKRYAEAHSAQPVASAPDGKTSS
jgi:Histidine kinase-, DNA gyrase B-, and HSP90-like ATPase